MEQTGWPKRITVDKRIVGLLSRSTYENFPKAIREAVSNSYDADATTVRIDIDLVKGSIVIEDDGIGMTPNEFGFYLRIAGKPRGKGRSVKFDRKRIGRLGVGFLALFPFCEALEVTSTAESSESIFVALIPTKEFLREPEIMEDVSEIPVEGHETIARSEQSRHYTRLRLIGITPIVYEYFHPKAAKYGGGNNVSSWPGFERLKWELQETLPLDFPNRSVLGKALGQKPVGMEVWLNGTRLFRNDPGGEALESNKGHPARTGSIVFNYAIATKWEPIHPYNARGLKIRLNNVGIGERTYFDLGIRGRTWSRLHWIAGEIHILEGLDAAIALDRDSFTWSPEYEDFRDFFRELLSKQAYAIEDIAVAEKRISSLMERSTTTTSGPAEKEVAHQLEILESRGFEIVRQRLKSPTNKKPVKVDKAKKVVTVVENHPYFKDVISLSNESFKVKYDRWDYRTTRFPACRLMTNGWIKVNIDYPLFKDATRGQFFLKLHLLLLLAKRRTRNRAEMYDYLVNSFLEEFSR
jgi:hypothetical protein